MTVLVLNSGSSSLKYQLLDPAESEPLAVGLIERIGESGSRATHRSGGHTHKVSTPVPDHAVAVAVVQRQFAAAGTPLDQAGLVAVGHRVVHGGAEFAAPVLVDADVLDRIRALSDLAPLHNPANATGIAAARAAFPGVPQVAVFDTAFFADLPAAASTYALDRELARSLRIHRYGFHGTSHQYVSRRAAEYAGREDLDQIVLHLGNGASASAVHHGRAVETSMGLTPLEGLVMGTRSGDVDPGVLFHLLRVGGLTVDEVDATLNRRSGLLGLAGVSDMRDLTDRAEHGDADARLALDVYCHRVRKYIGAYLAVLGRLDQLVFTAGVGENAPAVRAGILAGLSGLGLAVEPERNAAREAQLRVISPEGAAITVLVVPTNEELAIARAAIALVG